jgi:aspartyl-tRNA synthetase
MRLEGNVQAVVAPGAASWSRKQLDELARSWRNRGRARRLHREGDGRRNHFAARKESRRGRLKKLARSCRRKAGDLIVAAAAKEQIAHTDTSLAWRARFASTWATSSI